MKHHLIAILAGAVVMIIFWLVYDTPTFLSNLTWHRTYERVYRERKKRGGSLRALRYNHATTDGALLHKQVSTGVIRPFSWTKTHVPKQCAFETTIAIPDLVDASPFFNVIVHVCLLQRRRPLNIGLLVSTRHKLDDFTTKGCFVRTARTTVTSDDTKHTIVTKLRESVDAVLADERVNDSIADRMHCFSTDLLFNKWSLDEVECNGKVFKLVRGGTRRPARVLSELDQPHEIKVVRAKRPGQVDLLITPMFG